MARWIRADGTEEQRKPKGRKWTLEELQAAVGGYIELMPWQPLRFIINEEGKLRGLPHNELATRLLQEQIARTLHCTVAQLSSEVGRRLRYLPTLCGDVLILDKGERM